MAAIAAAGREMRRASRWYGVDGKPFAFDDVNSAAAGRESAAGRDSAAQGFELLVIRTSAAALEAHAANPGRELLWLPADLLQGSVPRHRARSRILQLVPHDREGNRRL